MYLINCNKDFFFAFVLCCIVQPDRAECPLCWRPHAHVAVTTSARHFQNKLRTLSVKKDYVKRRGDFSKWPLSLSLLLSSPSCCTPERRVHSLLFYLFRTNRTLLFCCFEELAVNVFASSWNLLSEIDLDTWDVTAVAWGAFPLDYTAAEWLSHLKWKSAPKSSCWFQSVPAVQLLPPTWKKWDAEWSKVLAGS